MLEIISKQESEIAENKSKSFYSKLKDEFALMKIDNEISRHKNAFEKEASNIFFTPISIQENYTGNYDNYIRIALTHIVSLKELPFEKALSNQDLYKYYPFKELSQSLISNKKLLLLDLDETLIHSEYEIKNENINSYDTIIKFKDDSNDGPEEYFSVGIYLRNGVHKFLNILNNYFTIGIFTASQKEYADAILQYLDPDKNIIKFCLYRNNCINVNDLVNIKDLRIIKDIDLKKTVLIDNNMYSFAPQLSNGILINSFYGDKNDVELFNVLNYLMEFIFPADDVREVNEKIFGFNKILQQLE
jgi:Dullard-like phosphatase family protein